MTRSYVGDGEDGGGDASLLLYDKAVDELAKHLEKRVSDQGREGKRK